MDFLRSVHTHVEQQCETFNRAALTMLPIDLLADLAHGANEILICKTPVVERVVSVKRSSANCMIKHVSLGFCGPTPVSICEGFTVQAAVRIQGCFSA